MAIVAILLAVTPPAGGQGIALVATDLTSGRVIVCRPVGDGDRVVLSFTHSMYGGEVREEYVATADGLLRRLEISTANLAAAEYYAYTAGVVRTGDRFRLDVPVATFDHIVVRVDGVGRHHLAVGRQTVDLLVAAGDGHRVRLEAERVAGWRRLLGGTC